MAGPPARVSDDGSGLLHDRFPVGVRRACDQDLPAFEAANLLHRAYDVRPSLTYHLADRLTFDDDFSLLLQPVRHQDASGFRSMDGLRPCLEDVEMPRSAVLRPLYVHGHSVMLLDLDCPGSEQLRLLVRDYKSDPLRGGNGPLNGPAATRVDELLVLQSELLIDDLPGLLEHVEAVGIDRALDDVLPQTVRSIDVDDVPETGLGVQSEQHSCGCQIGPHHELDSGREIAVEVGEVPVHPVGNRSVREERGETLLNGAHDAFGSAHVQI